MLIISNNVAIPEHEIELSAVRAQGPGGQKVNKSSSAIHLRFDISNSSLPEYYKKRLLALNDLRITKNGLIVIKAQQFRSQQQNREAALLRLQSLVQSVKSPPRKRIPTRPSKTVHQKRLDHKARRGQIKRLRGRVAIES